MRGQLLPANWQPADHDRHYGLRLGLTNDQVDACAEDMRLWAGANAHREIARKANWSMAFKGWMRREAVKIRRGRSQSPNGVDYGAYFEAGYERGNPRNFVNPALRKH